MKERNYRFHFHMEGFDVVVGTVAICAAAFSIGGWGVAVTLAVVIGGCTTITRAAGKAGEA